LRLHALSPPATNYSAGKNKADGVRPPSADYLDYRPEPVGGALPEVHPPICGLPLVLPSDLTAPFIVAFSTTWQQTTRRNQ